MRHSFAYDILVSYVSSDRKWGEWITQVLGRECRVVALEDGSVNAPELLASAPKLAKRVVPVLSPASLGSGEEEYWQVWCGADPLGKLRRIVPVLIERCKPSGFLGPIVYIDLTTKPAVTGDTSAYLLEKMGCTESRTPLVEPPFPG